MSNLADAAAPTTMTSPSPSPDNDFVPWPPDDVNHSIVRRFERELPRWADRLAAADGECSLTYRELHHRAGRLAHALIALPIPPGERVALMLDHGVDGVVGILGALKAGAVAVPIDASAPPERLKYVLEDSQAKCVVTSAPAPADLRKLPSSPLTFLSMSDLPENALDRSPGLDTPPESPAFLLYTSGSTGKPKGVIHTHRVALHRRMISTTFCHICADDRFALLSSYSFSWSIGSITGAMLNGASVWFYDVKHRGLVGLADWLQDSAITYLPAVSSLFRNLVATLTPGHTFPHLRVVSLGGETVLPSDFELFKAHFGDHTLFRTSLGLTEVGSISSAFLDASSRVEGDLLPVGYPAPEVEILILDENLNPLPPGSAGQIAAKGCFLSPGYWRKPERTAQSFLPDPAGTDATIYLTGDLGRVDPDGLIYHLGRIDSQVKVRGARVEIGEIENILLALPAIDNAAIVARDDAVGEKHLVAYVETRQSPPPTVSALRADLRRSLQDYQVPSRFVFMEALPLTVSGKVDRKTLPDPEPSRPELDAPFLAPETPLEKELADTWSHLLGVSPVGVRDSFFDLGGHSLLAVQLVSAVLKSTGKNLPLATLLEAPTIRAMADILQSDTWSTPDSCLVALQSVGDKPPLFCLPGAGMDVVHFQPLAKALAPHNQPVYSFQARGMDGKHPPHTAIEEMADDYIAELTALHPTGPVFLAGRCMGGFIAFEMARRLTAAGRDVPLVVLLNSSQPPPPITLPEYLRCLFTYQLPAGRFFFCLSRDIRERLRALRLKTTLRRQRRNVLRVWKALENARRSYRPQPYAGKLTLFQSREFSLRFPEYRPRWEALAGGGLESYLIDGGHWGVLVDPNLSIITNRLSALVDQALATPAPSS